MDIAVHKKFKAECARLGVSMASVIREMLRQEAERLAGQAEPAKAVKPLKTRSASRGKPPMFNRKQVDRRGGGGRGFLMVGRLAAPACSRKLPAYEASPRDGLNLPETAVTREKANLQDALDRLAARRAQDYPWRFEDDRILAFCDCALDPSGTGCSSAPRLRHSPGTRSSAPHQRGLQGTGEPA